MDLFFLAPFDSRSISNSDLHTGHNRQFQSICNIGAICSLSTISSSLSFYFHLYSPGNVESLLLELATFCLNASPCIQIFLSNSNKWNPSLTFLICVLSVHVYNGRICKYLQVSLACHSKLSSKPFCGRFHIPGSFYPLLAAVITSAMRYFHVGYFPTLQFCAIAHLTCPRHVFSSS